MSISSAKWSHSEGRVPRSAEGRAFSRARVQLHRAYAECRPEREINTLQEECRSLQPLFFDVGKTLGARPEGTYLMPVSDGNTWLLQPDGGANEELPAHDDFSLSQLESVFIGGRVCAAFVEHDEQKLWAVLTPNRGGRSELDFRGGGAESVTVLSVDALREPAELKQALAQMPVDGSPVWVVEPDDEGESMCFLGALWRTSDPAACIGAVNRPGYELVAVGHRIVAQRAKPQVQDGSDREVAELQDLPHVVCEALGGVAQRFGSGAERLVLGPATAAETARLHEEPVIVSPVADRCFNSAELARWQRRAELGQLVAFEDEGMILAVLVREDQYGQENLTGSAIRAKVESDNKLLEMVPRKGTPPDVGPQGLEPEFERTPGEPSIAERLSVADEAVEDALRAVETAEQTRRALQKLRLKELEERYRAVVASFFNGNSKEAQGLLADGKVLVVRVVDGTDATAVLEDARAAKGVTKSRAWSLLSKSAADQVSEVVKTGQEMFFSHYGKTIAVLRPTNAEDAEFLSLSDFS